MASPSPSPRRPAVVLLSGGLDSATCLAIAQAESFAPHALTFAYGQRHDAELDAARALAERAGVPWALRTLPPVGGSALTGHGEVPKGRGEDERAEGIPSTYVPVRNTVFLAHALQEAEVLGADDVFIGVNAVDYSGYPDCRPEFLARFEALAAVCSKRAVEGRPPRIHAPLLQLSKADIVRRGAALGVDFARTRSCYAPDAAGAACGACDACAIRLAAFREAGIEDPAPYAAAVGGA
jgi:7-cyano-7-deazaguanine synthase